MLPKHNYYIVNNTAPLQNLADAFYDTKNHGVRDAFLTINRSICPTGLTTIGQTLYLPSTNDNHAHCLDQLQNHVVSIDKST